MSECSCHREAQNALERQTLRILLFINGAMFFLEIVVGILGDSTALIADSLDMLADASVYAISFYAVGQSPQDKIRAAFLSGMFQVSLAGMVAIDVLRRLFVGNLPESEWMMGISLGALIANSYCLYLLSEHRQGEVHMRASWIFTQNDVIANVSVIIAGLLVKLFNSRLPDLIVGFSIAVLVAWGGVTIIREAHQDKTQFSRIEHGENG